MKFSGALILFCVAVAPFSLAAEVIESLKTRGGREYLKVEVLTVDDVGIRIRHDAGTARISYQDLPDSLQAKYHFDRKKAEAAKAKESQNLAEHEKSFEPPPIAAVPKKRPVPKSAAASEADPAADAQELENLEAYIADMKGMVKTKTAEALNLRAQATTERSRVRYVKSYSYNSSNDSVRSGGAAVPDKAGYAKADKYDEDATTLERQISKARILIGTAEAKYARLTGTPVSP
jgi:type II secretory pathway component HofQ